MEIKMPNKIIKLGNQKYLVNPFKIKKISFEIEEHHTRVWVKYVYNRYSEHAFNVQNTAPHKMDYKIISDLYVSIMALNDELVEAKGL